MTRTVEVKIGHVVIEATVRILAPATKARTYGRPEDAVPAQGTEFEFVSARIGSEDVSSLVSDVHEIWGALVRAVEESDE